MSAFDQPDYRRRLIKDGAWAVTVANGLGGMIGVLVVRGCVCLNPVGEQVVKLKPGCEAGLLEQLSFMRGIKTLAGICSLAVIPPQSDCVNQSKPIAFHHTALNDLIQAVESAKRVREAGGLKSDAA